MNKRILGLFLALLMVLSLVPAVSAAAGEAWMSFYVSPNGSDDAQGTEAAPFKTLQRAQEEVRKYNKNMQGDITVNLMPGRYELDDFFEMTIEDSGSNGFSVIWQGTDASNLPVISGGRQITGWTEGENGIWQAQAENLEYARDLYINGRVGTRARMPKLIRGKGTYIDESSTIVNRKTGAEHSEIRGYYVDKTQLGLYENPEDIDLFYRDTFRARMFRVDDIVQDPNNENQVILMIDRTMLDTLQSSGDAKTHPERAFLLENAFELLDEPGEFYFNKKTKTMYYIPREGEDMSTAEVICPQLERLTYIHGLNYYNRLHDLHFRNIQFSHTSDLLLEVSSMYGAQGEFHYTTYRPGPAPHGSNIVDWAENISFKGCVFSGLGTIGLYFRNGVFHSDITGNVFADIGGAGIMAGTIDHLEFTELVDTGGPYDVALHAPFEASYQGFDTAPHQQLNMSRRDEHSMLPGTGWYSEPWAKKEGTIPFIKVRLETYYNLESIQFSFPDDATEEERSNYEVLVSKYRDFREYKTLATYTEPTDFDVKIPVADGEKYRFVMLRKTVSGPFCLDAFYAWSNDRPAIGNMGVPEYCNITDNYITRTALGIRDSYGIMVTYTRGFNILHNEIYDVPYTAISVGWGWEWSMPKTTGENNISYNRIDNFMNCGSDGGGIYIFADQPNALLKGNYFTNNLHNGMALYYDTGGKGITSTENVAINAGWTLSCKLTIENALINNWADYPQWRTYEPRTDNHTTIEDPHAFSYNDPPDEVRRIMAEAGISDEWLFIKERIPEADTQRINIFGPDSADVINNAKPVSDAYAATEERNTQMIGIAETMIEGGTYGNLPWEFDPASKVELAYWVNAMKKNNNREDDFSKGHAEEMITLNDAIIKANDSVYHPSYEEMVTMCNEMKSVATNKDYPQAAIDTFNKEVAEITSKTYEGRGDKAVAAGHLERAYTKLYYESYKPSITAVVVDDAKTVIDKENKKVTVELPIGVKPEEVKPEIFVAKGTEIADAVSDINFASGTISIPLKTTKYNTYDFWTIEVIANTEETVSGHISTKGEDWINGNVNTTSSNVGGAVTIEPWINPTMYTKPVNGSLGFSLWAPRADKGEGISFVFGAQTENLLATTHEAKHSYYKATIKDQTLTLYKVESGKATAIATVSKIGFEYGKFNDFELVVQAESSYDRITIKKGGFKILDILEDAPIGATGYFGVMTKYIPVKVK